MVDATVSLEWPGLLEMQWPVGVSTSFSTQIQTVVRKQGHVPGPLVLALYLGWQSACQLNEATNLIWVKDSLKVPPGTPMWRNLQSLVYINSAYTKDFLFPVVYYLYFKRLLRMLKFLSQNFANLEDLWTCILSHQLSNIRNPSI